MFNSVKSNFVTMKSYLLITNHLGILVDCLKVLQVIIENKAINQMCQQRNIKLALVQVCQAMVTAK